jgi:hypothetical protein
MPLLLLLLQTKGQSGAVRKLYRCLASAAPPLGRHVHWVSLGQRKAGEPPHTLAHSQEVEGSSQCVLEVLKVRR